AASATIRRTGLTGQPCAPALNDTQSNAMSRISFMDRLLLVHVGRLPGCGRVIEVAPRERRLAATIAGEQLRLPALRARVDFRRIAEAMQLGFERRQRRRAFRTACEVCQLLRVAAQIEELG